MAIKKHINWLKKRYMRYLKIIYNDFLNIAKFVLLTSKLN